MTSGYDGRVVFWDLRKKKEISVSKGDGYLVSGLAFLEKIGLVAASTGGGNVLLFDAKSGQFVRKLKAEFPINALAANAVRSSLVLGFGDPTRSPVAEANRGKIQVLDKKSLQGD